MIQRDGIIDIISEELALLHGIRLGDAVDILQHVGNFSPTAAQP